jgi:hypothetical protein
VRIHSLCDSVHLICHPAVLSDSTPQPKRSKLRSGKKKSAATEREQEDEKERRQEKAATQKAEAEAKKAEAQARRAEAVADAARIREETAARKADEKQRKDEEKQRKGEKDNAPPKSEYCSMQNRAKQHSPAFYSELINILVVPNAKAATIASEKIRLRFDDSFDDALDDIYQTIGCDNVTRKPHLLYKLATAPRKSLAMVLETDRHWDTLRDEVHAATRKKKGDVEIEITTSPDNVRSAGSTAQTSSKSNSRAIPVSREPFEAAARQWEDVGQGQEAEGHQPRQGE